MYECSYRSVFYAADEKVSKCEIFIDNIYFLCLKEMLVLSVTNCTRNKYPNVTGILEY